MQNRLFAVIVGRNCQNTLLYLDNSGQVTLYISVELDEQIKRCVGCKSKGRSGETFSTNQIQMYGLQPDELVAVSG